LLPKGRELINIILGKKWIHFNIWQRYSSKNFSISELKYQKPLKPFTCFHNKLSRPNKQTLQRKAKNSFDGKACYLKHADMFENSTKKGFNKWAISWPPCRYVNRASWPKGNYL